MELLVFALLAIGLLVSGPVALFLSIGARTRLIEVEAIQRRLLRMATAHESPNKAREERLDPLDAAPVKRPAAIPPELEVLVTAADADATVQRPPEQAIPQVQDAERAGGPAQASAPIPIRAAPVHLRKSWSDIEEAIGTRWAVWVGGLAIVVGALLMVRYAVQSSHFGPAARIASGYLLAGLLCGASEAIRRGWADAAGSRRPSIAAVLAAAGIVAAYGATYASYALYGFVTPTLDLICLGAIGAAALALSALHGQAIAALGIAGALGAPVLVGADWTMAVPLAVYLPAVTATAYASCRRRGWGHMAFGTAGAAAVWSIALTGIVRTGHGGAGPAEVHVLIQAILAAAAFERGPSRFAIGGGEFTERMMTSGFAFSVALMLTAVLAGSADVVAAASGIGLATWIATAAAGSALLVVFGLRRDATMPAVLAGAAVLLCTIMLWPSPLVLTGTAFGTVMSHADPFASGLLLGAALVAAIAAAAACTAGAMRLTEGRRDDALALTATSAATPPAILLAVALRLANESSDGFAAIARAGLAQRDGRIGVLAVAAVVAALGSAGLARFFAFGRIGTAPEVQEAATGAYAVGSVVATALAAYLVLSGATLTLALSGIGLATALVSRLIAGRELRWSVTAMATWVAGRIALDPFLGAFGPTGTAWADLALGYGIPAVAFGLAARAMPHKGRADDAAPLACEALATMLAGCLAFLETHQELHGGNVRAAMHGLNEQGLFALVGAGLAGVLSATAVSGSMMRRLLATAAYVGSQAQAAIMLLVIVNPAVTGELIPSGALLNGLLLGYGLPAAAGFVLARALEARGERTRAMVTRCVATALTFAYATLSVRLWFQGDDLRADWAEPSQGEWFSYSAAWLTIGIAVLAYGVLRRSVQARAASAVFVALSVVKVFLFDLSGLEGPLRAASFIGLGVTLIGIGLVYQRVLFAPGGGKKA